MRPKTTAERLFRERHISPGSFDRFSILVAAEILLLLSPKHSSLVFPAATIKDADISGKIIIIIFMGLC
jgi:hypothetical protein